MWAGKPGPNSSSVKRRAFLPLPITSNFPLTKVAASCKWNGRISCEEASSRGHLRCIRPSRSRRSTRLRHLPARLDSPRVPPIPSSIVNRELGNLLFLRLLPRDSGLRFSGMEFTEAYKQSGPCCFSPNARFIAVAVDYRLVIRDTLSLKVVQLFSCLDKISYIEWALDSEYILCGLYKRPMIQAWSLIQPEWTCKIDEGPAGIAYARWSPDSRHILTTSDFQLRLTVWSLVNTACVHVQWPKHASKGVSFTRDGKFAAICTRHDCKDYINLLSCHNWEIMGVFAVDTLDLADIQWSPDDSAIVIWDSPLEYKVLVYSPDGRCLFKYQAYESGLGVKSVSWSPCGQFLAVGSYDQMLRVLSHLTWKTFAEFTHLSNVRAPCCAAIFKEVDEPLQIDMSELSLSDDYMQGNSGKRCSRGTLQSQI
ncbi:hypothetical protein EUGRSUZ_A02922 [Eucalyptus grandis]|uniref:Uncharacterized protein n=2 Tax=Eucalyptus grandis TaxID=71139 RepID=A0ACC3M832_EUCGR|nr:hypothetical protein EUGRSUZ_A02922 [Eucalyptus grandis]